MITRKITCDRCEVELPCTPSYHTRIREACEPPVAVLTRTGNGRGNRQVEMDLCPACMKALLLAVIFRVNDGWAPLFAQEVEK